MAWRPSTRSSGRCGGMRGPLPNRGRRGSPTRNGRLRFCDVGAVIRALLHCIANACQRRLAEVTLSGGAVRALQCVERSALRIIYECEVLVPVFKQGSAVLHTERKIGCRQILQSEFAPMSKHSARLLPNRSQGYQGADQPDADAFLNDSLIGRRSHPGKVTFSSHSNG